MGAILNNWVILKGGSNTAGREVGTGGQRPLDRIIQYQVTCSGAKFNPRHVSSAINAAYRCMAGCVSVLLSTQYIEYSYMLKEKKTLPKKKQLSKEQMKNNFGLGRIIMIFLKLFKKCTRERSIHD